MITLHNDAATFQTSLCMHTTGTAGFSDEHLRELARNSFEASFLPPEKKLRCLQQIDFAVLKTP